MDEEDSATEQGWGRGVKDGRHQGLGADKGLVISGTEAWSMESRERGVGAGPGHHHQEGFVCI